MSTKTTNLEMTLLAEEDNFDTNVYNENFQKTDDKIGELNSMLGSEELTTTSQTHSGAINELNKNFRNLIIVERKISEVVEVPAKNPKSIPLINLEKTGYTPIGIVGIAGIEGCFIYNYEVIGNELRSYIYNNTDISKGRYMYGYKGRRQAFNEKEAPLWG